MLGAGSRTWRTVRNPLPEQKGFSQLPRPLVRRQLLGHDYRHFCSRVASMSESKRRAPERSFFEEHSGAGAPWETGRPQTDLVKLTDSGFFDGSSVLDIGCCVGDNSCYIAKHAKGASVTGCDLVERALGLARQKAAEAGLEITFIQQDMLAQPQGPLQGAQFDIVLDSAVYHVFEPGPERDAYVANLGKLVKPGGRVVMLVFSDKQPGEWGPVRVSQADIHASYAPPTWTVESIEDATVESIPSVFDGVAKGYLARIRKAA